MSNSPVVESLKQKVDRLIEDNRKLLSDRDKARQQSLRLQEQNRELVEQVAALEHRMSVLELSQGFSGGSEDKKLAKARVNRLMREVDKCIALLNR